IEVPVETRRAERLGELVRDTRPAELGKRIPGRSRGDDRAVGQLVSRPVVVADDDLEPEPLRLGDLLDGRDPAVDGQDEAATLVGEARQRLAREPVALLESTRQMPVDVGSEIAERRYRERRRADAVDVVVAVDADPLPGRERVADGVAGPVDVAEEPRIMERCRPLEERPSGGRVAVP